MKNNNNDYLKVSIYYIGSLLISTLILTPYFIINRGSSENRADFLLLLAASGATISALLTTLIFDGKKGLIELIKKVIQLRFKWYWYVMSILLMPIVMILLWFFGRHFNIPFENPFSKIQNVLPVFIIISIQAGLGEEIGWRGLMTPTLNKKMNLLLAAIFTGILWGLWHTPLFFIEEMFQSEITAQVGFFIGMGWYILFLVGSSILYSFVVKKSGGSLVGAILFHGSLNTSTWLVNANDVSVSLAGLQALTITVFIISIILYLITRKDKCWKIVSINS